MGEGAFVGPNCTMEPGCEARSGIILTEDSWDSSENKNMIELSQLYLAYFNHVGAMKIGIVGIENIVQPHSFFSNFCIKFTISVSVNLPFSDPHDDLPTLHRLHLRAMLSRCPRSLLELWWRVVSQECLHRWTGWWSMGGPWDVNQIYPLVMTNVAIENGHL